VRRWLRLGAAVARSNVGDPRLPFRATFAVTSRCELRCGMCGIWRSRPGAELTTAEIERFFAGAGWLSWLNLTGGEIFARPDAEAILEAAVRRCRALCLLNFPTNGQETGRIVDAVQRIVVAGPVPRAVVTVSVDGPRAVHDAIRGVPGAWERAVATFRGLAALRSRRFSVLLGFTAQAANAGTFSEMLAELAREDARITAADVHVNLAHVSPAYYRNAGFAGEPAAGEALALLAEVSRRRGAPALDLTARLERAYRSRAATWLATRRTPLPCQAAASNCFIDPQGEVYACSSATTPIGSLRDHGFDLGPLWASARRREARADVRAGRCPQCWTPCEAHPSILASMLTGGARP
jgi:MoaA/NifB/PqqE/SkfB family radical SAM enzyme